jgi:membrane-bound lytic murein transglycosylase F
MWITATTGTLESRPRPITNVLKGALMGILCAVLAACPSETIQSHSGPLPRDSLDEVLARGKLRVVSRVNPATFVVDKHGPSGIEFELARAFAEKIGVELEMIPAANIAEVYAALDSGTADMAASGLSARLSGTSSYWYSSPYLEVRQQIVYRSGSARPRCVADLVGKRVMVLAQSSSADALAEAQRAHPGLGWMEATRIETFELLRKIMDDEIDYAIVKSNEFEMHEGLFPGIEIAFELEEREQLAWATAERGRNARLHASMQNFLARYEESGELDLLRERFFGYLPEINRKALTTFAERVESHLPRFERALRRIGAEEGIDWRLLAAISYQESHWNPRAVSYTGVRGMMMLTKATAREVGVTDRTNLEQSLRGGARYFLKLLEQVSEDIAPSERELFALAAYNIGPAHVEDARRIAEMRGADPDVWADVEKQLPLLTKRAWHSRTRHGYARGYETLNFVNRIRQYHRFLEHHDEESNMLQVAQNARTSFAQLPARS